MAKRAQKPTRITAAPTQSRFGGDVLFEDDSQRGKRYQFADEPKRFRQCVLGRKIEIFANNFICGSCLLDIQDIKQTDRLKDCPDRMVAPFVERADRQEEVDLRGAMDAKPQPSALLMNFGRPNVGRMRRGDDGDRFRKSAEIQLIQRLIDCGKLQLGLVHRLQEILT